MGFSWDHSDEVKMQESYGLGREDIFPNFVDVRVQAEIMGYHNIGLRALSKILLGFEPPKSQLVSLPRQTLLKHCQSKN